MKPSVVVVAAPHWRVAMGRNRPSRDDPAKRTARAPPGPIRPSRACALDSAERPASEMGPRARGAGEQGRGPPHVAIAPAMERRRLDARLAKQDAIALMERYGERALAESFAEGNRDAMARGS